MKLKAYLFGVALLGAFAGFWLYSGVRTFDESIGFHLSSARNGLLAALFFTMPITISLMTWLKSPLGGSYRAALLFGIALLTGCGVGEIQILRDEAAFSREASASKKSFSRDRAWPSGSASLVFLPVQGIHATD